MLMMKNSYHDLPYLDLIEYIIKCGVWKENRTGIRIKSVFGQQMIFDLSDGTIPLLTTKQMHTKSIIHELLWYLMGTGNIKYLQDNGVRIWNEWADENGDLGPVYGQQWRKWKTQPINHPEAPKVLDMPWFTAAGLTRTYTYPDEIDQIAVLIDTLKNNPNDRRMIVSAWNVGEIDQMALPPCHYMFQCYVANNKLSMILNQRSCDVGLGIPFNIVQYSLLLRMLAEVTNLEPGELIWNGGDVHIYENHIHLLAEQVHREVYPSPTFKFARRVTDIDDFKFEDFLIEGYQSHPSIKMTVAV
jgi:thymidylate synthase